MTALDESSEPGYVTDVYDICLLQAEFTHLSGAHLHPILTGQNSSIALVAEVPNS